MSDKDEPERQRFEHWYLSRPNTRASDLKRERSGKYYHPTTQWRWEAWQAALSSKQEEA